MLECVFEVIKKVANFTENQQLIIDSMKADAKVSAVVLFKIVGISKRKVEENVAKLKKLGLIERVGGTRGYWVVKG